TNFLSCQDTEIEFDNITALIGRNAAGKTNILKAIEHYSQFVVGNVSLYDHFSQGEPYRLEVNFNIEFLINNENFKYEIDTKTESDGCETNIFIIESLSYYTGEKWELIVERNNGSATHYNEKEKINFEIKLEASLINSTLALLPKKSLNPVINKIFEYLSGIKYYALDDAYRNSYSNRFVYGSDYTKWVSIINEKKPSVVMRLLHIWNEDKELLNELKLLIGKNGLNLVDDIEINKLNISSSINVSVKVEDYFYTIVFHIEKATVSYAQLSYGTQRVLAILLTLLYDKNSTLLIEQPEDGIHTGLLHKLLPLCFEYAEVYNKQLIFTTHSSEAINLFKPENIRLVKITEHGTKVSALDKEQMPFIHDYLKNEGALFDFIKSMNDE
ncbi:MAG: ATP-binding protein, partial [Methylococcaceae bacterium]|nr:ATP-binding protein [Methylococcaceae bacterium]